MSKLTPYIRKKGNKKGCDELVRRAKQEMIRTRAMATQAGVPVTQRYTVIDESKGIYILTRASLDMDLIEIVYPYQENPLPEVIREEEQKTPEIKYVGFYSGLTTMNDMTLGPPPDYDEGEFNKFNPTIDCRESYPDDFVEGLAYNSVNRLALRAHPDIWMDGSFPEGARQYNDNYDGQTNLVKACQYSGPIAEIVAVLLGLGTNHMTGEERITLLGADAHPWWVSYVQALGFAVQYDFKFLRCHQAIQNRTDGSWWLMEFSITNGIIVRALPMLNAEVLIGTVEPNSVAENFVKKFGGIPSGEAFPDSRAEIIQGIADGWINELMNPSQYMAQFLQDQLSYSILNSWTFNEDATEARTTSYEYNNYNMHQNNYWKMSISSSVLFTPDIDKIASGVCVGPRHKEDITRSAVFMPNNLDLLGVLFYNPEPGQSESYRHQFEDLYLPASLNTNAYSGIPAIMDQVVWVGRVNGRWEEVRYRQNLIGSWERTDHDLVTTDADGNPSTAAWHFVQLQYMNEIGTKRCGSVQYEISFIHNYSTSTEFDHPISWWEGDHEYFQSWSRRVVQQILVGTLPRCAPWGAWETDYLWVSNANNQPNGRALYFVCGWNRNAYISHASHSQPATNKSTTNNINMLNKDWLWSNGIGHQWAYVACPPFGTYGGMSGTTWPYPWPWPEDNSIIGNYETGYQGCPPSNIGLYGSLYDFPTDGDPGDFVVNLDSCWPDWECTPVWVHVGWGNYRLDYFIPDGFLEHKTDTQDHTNDTLVEPTWRYTLFPDLIDDWWGVCQQWVPHSVYDGFTFENDGYVACNIATPGDPEWPVTPFYEHIVHTVEIHAVGHRVPGEKLELFKGAIVRNGQEYIPSEANLQYTAYVHTSTLGPEAAIFPNVLKQTGSTVVNYQTEYISSGIMPSLPENETDVNFWWTCTFVGINGPSAP